MNPRVKTLAISGLRWALGLVVLWESAHFALSAAGAHQFATTGLPEWIRPALGGSEAVGALLFLAPAVSLVGGYALLVIFAIAVCVHFLHGQYEVGALIVYGMAAIVCITHRMGGRGEARDDR
jgi:DoxX-like family